MWRFDFQMITHFMLQRESVVPFFLGNHSLSPQVQILEENKFFFF